LTVNRLKREKTHQASDWLALPHGCFHLPRLGALLFLLLVFINQTHVVFVVRPRRRRGERFGFTARRDLRRSVSGAAVNFTSNTCRSRQRGRGEGPPREPISRSKWETPVWDDRASWSSWIYSPSSKCRRFFFFFSVNRWTFYYFYFYDSDFVFEDEEGKRVRHASPSGGFKADLRRICRNQTNNLACDLISELVRRTRKYSGQLFKQIKYT